MPYFRNFLILLFHFLIEKGIPDQLKKCLFIFTKRVENSRNDFFIEV